MRPPLVILNRTARRAWRFLLACTVALALTVQAAENIPPTFADHVHVRGSLDNCRLAFTHEKKGTVAFIGGSITEMNGYRPMVSDLLHQRFPDTAFTVIDAGISSTCSTTGAFRLDRDILAKGPLDLLFVEFAVNDDQDAHHTRAECIRGMEGIIRHARTANPNVDIAMTFFLNEGMMQTLKSGKTPLTSEAHTAVAAHYDIPTIDLAKEVTTQIGAGSLTWAVYGGVHPAPAGNALCTRMIGDLFTRAWSTELPADAKAVAHRVPAPLDAMNYGAGRFLADTDAKLGPGWSLGIPDWKALPGGKRDRFTTIPMICATEPGAQLSLPFTGTAVGAYVVAGPDAGIAEASVDGGAFVPVNLFHDYSKGLHYPRTVLFASDLMPGAHTLILRVSNDTTSSGHALRIMHFVAN